MSSDFLGERGRALENSFFAKKNEELLQQLRDQMQSDSKRQAISDASGITDDTIIDELLAIGMDGETVAALALVPLVEVAWADGSIADNEREALVSACDEIGIKKGSPAFSLLQQWTDEAPGPELLETWKDYVKALCESMKESVKEAIRTDIMGRAKRIAESAGGFLGLTSAISAAEQAKLDELESVF
jgi:hypothetical protein